MRAAGEKLPVETLVRALIEPPILSDGNDGTAPQCEIIRMLYGRVLTEPSDVVRRIVKDLFGEPSRQFEKLMRQTHPKLDDATFYWRFTCAIGSFMFAQSFGDRVASHGGLAPGAIDWRFVVDEIVGVITRGMAGDAK